MSDDSDDKSLSIDGTIEPRISVMSSNLGVAEDESYNDLNVT